MADEGLHEIQLNGKQLVFLFMASTVVAVVIFLCGVMVGRGVRVQQPLEASVDVVSDPTAITQTPLPAAPATVSPSNAPVASQETLSYPNLLEGHEPVEDALKPVATSPKLQPLVAKPAAAGPGRVAERRAGPSLSAQARSAKAEGPADGE